MFGKGYHIHDALNTLDRSLKYLKHILFETRVDRLVGEHLKKSKEVKSSCIIFLHSLARKILLGLEMGEEKKKKTIKILLTLSKSSPLKSSALDPDVEFDI